MSAYFYLSQKHHVYATTAIIFDQMENRYKCFLPQQCIFLRFITKLSIWHYSKMSSKKQCYFFFFFSSDVQVHICETLFIVSGFLLSACHRDFVI